MTVNDIYQAINRAADFSLALDFDNAGLLVGDPDAQVSGVLIALDATPDVVDEAVARGANLIVVHHPVIFHPLKQVLADSIVHRLIRANISVICAHTNLDIAAGGVNDLLAQKLELIDTAPLPPENLLRVGRLARGMTPPEFAYYVKQKLDLPALRYSDGGRAIERVAVCGGAGGSELAAAAAAGCQAYVTGDVKHDLLLEAIRLGVTILDGGHFGTECHIVDRLLELVRQTAPALPAMIAHAHADPSTTI